MTQGTSLGNCVLTPHGSSMYPLPTSFRTTCTLFVAKVCSQQDIVPIFKEQDNYTVTFEWLRHTF